MSKPKTLEEEIQAFSDNPIMQKMYREQLKVYGSMEGICRAVYGGSNNSNSNSSSINPTPSDSKSAGSSGKYMVHCYYGSQPGNKITTVIG
jgi:hypothetical protein